VLLTAAMLYLFVRRDPRQRGSRPLALSFLVLVAAQIGVGALVVLSGLTTSRRRCTSRWLWDAVDPGPPVGECDPGGRDGAIPAPELTPPGKPSAVLLAKPGIVAAVTLAGLSGMILAQGGVPKAGKALLTLACILGRRAGPPR